MPRLGGDPNNVACGPVGRRGDGGEPARCLPRSLASHAESGPARPSAQIAEVEKGRRGGHGARPRRQRHRGAAPGRFSADAGEQQATRQLRRSGRRQLQDDCHGRCAECRNRDRRAGDDRLNSGEAASTVRAPSRSWPATRAQAWLHNFAYVPSFRKDEWKAGTIHSARCIRVDSLETSSRAATAAGAHTTPTAPCLRRPTRAGSPLQDGSEGQSLTCADGFLAGLHRSWHDAARFEATPKLVKSNHSQRSAARSSGGGRAGPAN